ncbi:MAG: hypothetical protein ACOC20_06775 [Oceanicaulis sp.]
MLTAGVFTAVGAIPVLVACGLLWPRTRSFSWPAVAAALTLTLALAIMVSLLLALGLLMIADGFETFEDASMAAFVVALSGPALWLAIFLPGMVGLKLAGRRAA